MSGKLHIFFRGNQSILRFIVLISACFFLAGITIQAQNCSVNANVNRTICANETLMLIGSKAGLFAGEGEITWSQVTGPSAVIVSPHALETEVTGISGGYNYTFRLTTTCLDGSLVYDDVVYNVLRVRIANAGADQISCPASPAGNLAGNVPGPGSTGEWSIIGSNNGVTILDPSSPTSAFNLSTGEGTTTLRWTITHSSGCASFDDMVITNIGGQLPVNAGPDQVLGNCFSTTQSTTLSGSIGGNGTAGQGGLWSVVSGPGIPNIENPTNRNTGVSGLEEGVYIFRWTVTGPCANGSDEVQITVPAPTSDVTTASVIGGSQIWCDGRTSTVLSGTPPYYTNETVLWQQTNGPGGVTIESPTNPVTNITGLDGSSTYTFRYTIINNLTACASAETVTVSFAGAPAINIVPTQLFTSCNSGTASIPYTSGGSGITQWSILSGPSTPAYPTLPTGYFNAAGNPLVVNGLSVPGTYVISMRRYSNIGISCETAFDEISVIVSHTPTPSNAGTRQVLACNVFQTELTGNVPFVGTGSWSQVSGPGTATIVSPASPTTAITNLINGLYRFRWIISGGPACPAAQNTVTVLVASTVPTQANAGPDQNVCVGTPVFLAGNFAVLNESGVWSVLPATPGITFSNINSPVSMVNGLLANTIYTFTWTITNACGSTSDNCTINTSNTVGPVASDAGADQCHNTGTTSITLEGNDPAPGTGLWNKLTGPAATITNPALYNSTVTVMTDGNYTFEWVISSGGCLPTRDTVAVTISAPATTSNAGADIQLCGTSTSLSGNTPAVGSGLWTQTAGAGGVVITSPASPTTSVTGLADGVYTFYWTISNHACPASVDSVNVYVSSPGSAANAGPDKGVCAQTTVTMDATPPSSGTGVWTIVSGPNSPNIVDPTSSSTIINNLVTGTYIFRWTVSGGPYCPPTSDEVEVDVTLAANAGPDQSYCEATTAVNLEGTVSTAGTWTQDSGPNTATITTTSANTAVASGLIPGVYVFRFTISTPGCSTTDVMTVTLYQPPTTADAGPDQDLCDAVSFTLDGNVPAFGSGTWTKIAGPGAGSFVPSANTPNATYTGALPGVYVFVWTISNGTCSSGDQVRIENSASPTVSDAGPDQTQVCSDQTTMAANLPVIGVGNWTQISGPNTANISSVILPNTSITGLVPGVYTFRWTITNGVICAASSDDVVITALLTPTPADAGADQSLCNQASTTMAATPLTTGTGLWTQASGPNSAVFADATSPTSDVSNLVTGTYVFEWTTTEGVCTSVDQVTVQNDALPTVADAGADQDICLFSPLILSGNTPVNGTGLWTQTAGPVTVNILTPGSPTTSVIGALSGSYTFEWTISNGSCASSTDAVNVIINDIPDQALAGADQSLCNTDNTYLNGNNPAIGTGTWSQVSGPNTATIIDPFDRQTQVTGLIAGTYTFKWEIANGSCTSSDNMLVVHHPDIAVSGPSDNAICNGGTATLSISASGGTGGFTYQWESSADGNVPWSNISGATNSSFTTPALAADQYYRCLVTAGCGDTYSSIAHVTVVPDPSITVQPAGITICSGSSTTLSVTATGGTPSLNYQWQSSPNGSSGWANAGTNSNSYTTAVLTQTTYFRVIISAAGNGCNSVTSSVVAVSVPRITTQPVSSSVCTGGSVNALSIIVDPGSATLGYQWESAAALAGPYSSVTGGSGANTASYITDVLTATTYFRCVVTVTSPACADLVSGTATITVVPDPTINTQPSGTTICAGGTHALTVSATGGTPSLNYQWQSSTTGGAPWTNVGTNSASYTTTALAATTYYQVLVSATGTDCNTATSATATVTVVPDPTISVQPAGATICNGGTHSMTITATGNVPPGSLNYQWQISNTGTGGWTNVGTNSNAYTTAALAATRYYRVLVTQTASGCSTTSANAQVTVVPDPNITTQPTGASICYGGDHTMTIAAAGGTPSLNYQWQISTTGAGGPWSDLTGETGTGYTTPATYATTWYRVIVSATGAGCATVTSNVATVTVEGDPIINVQPAGAEICSGGNHSMSISASGGTPSLNYQWEYSTIGSGGPWTVIVGATANSYTTPALTVTTWYHVVVTAPGSDCNTTTTSAAEVTVVPDPAISVQPADITICSGTSTVLSVTALNGTPSLNYMWETSPNGTTGWATIGGNSNTYTTALLTQTTYYRVTVSATGNGCNSMISNVVAVSVPRILTQPVGASICSGGTHAMSVSIESGSATVGYQWQFSDFDCSSGWSDIGGATAGTYTATILPVTGTRYYRCQISLTSPDCANLVTDCTPVIVVADPAIISQPSGTTLCEGSAHSMTVIASGGTPSLTYQWQSASALAGPYSNVTGGSGSTSATYVTPALSSTTYFQVIVSASGVGCGSVTSSPVTVAINEEATAIAGSDDAICSNDSYTLSGASATNYTNLLWTTSGTGTFNNPTAINPVYTPGASDITAGSVILTLTAYANAPCVNAVSSMTLTISAFPTTAAGSDAIVCQGTAYTVSGATSTNYASLLWTAPGPGSLSNAATLTPTYTPTPGQTGTVTLTLTANPNGTCTASTDQMTITIDAAPTTANAGIDQSFCKSTTITNMTANTPVSGNGEWLQLSGPNSALITDDTDPATLVSNLITGIYFFQWTISNGVCASSSDLVQITVLNCGPVALDDNYSTPEDSPLSDNILTNDNDPDGDPLTVTQFVVRGTPYPAGSTVSMPGIGVIIVYSNGLFTFTPEPDYNGVVPTIPYTISDGTSTATADLDITVIPVNDPPVAVDEIVTTPEDTPAGGNLLTNDSDPDSDPISITQFVIAGDLTIYNPGDLAVIPGIGTLLINADGSYIFTPASGYNGPVPVATYTISDGSLTDTATLSIFVNPVNDLPLAIDDDVNTPEDTPVSGNLLTNDSDPDGDPLNITQFIVGGVTYPAGATVNIPGVGLITIYSNGLFNFTPSLNYTGPVPAIPYTITDGNGGTDSADLNITVTGVNDAPLALDDSNTTPEDTAVSGDVLSNDSDPDGDALAITQFVVDGDATVYLPGDLATITGVGTIIINANGTYTFTPELNYNGSVPVINYSISDGNGGADSAGLYITVTPVNDPPVAQDDTAFTTEDSPVSGTLVTNDSDVDGNLNPSSYSVVTGPANGTLVLNPNGSFTYSPDPDYNGTDTFTYEICDLGLPVYCDQATVTITINSTNDAPLAVHDVNTTLEENPVSGNVLDNDSDPEGDPLSVTQFIVDGDASVYLPGDVATITGIGTIVINTDGTYTFTPELNYNGTVPTITYTISDGNGGSDTADLDITVTPVNDPPVALDDSNTTNEDTPVSGSVIANDSDVDGNLNPAGYSVITWPANGILVLNPNGSYIYTPDPNFNGTDTFTYEVCDLGLPVYCDQATVTISVNGDNDAPVAVNDSNTTPEDIAVSGNVLTNDSDPEGDPMVVTQFVVDGDVTIYLPGDVATITGIGTIVINPGGTYTFTPELNYNGTVPTITYTISDGNGGSDTADLEITVTPVNDPPVALNDSNITNEDTPVSGSVIANDSDVDGNLNPASYSAVSGPANGILVLNPNGSYVYTPDPDFNGTDTFTYEVCDLGLPVYCDQATVTITVNAVNDTPVAYDDYFTTPEDTPVSGNVLVNDSDPEGDLLTVVDFTVDGTTYPAGIAATITGVGTIVLNGDGTFTFTPDTNYNGSVPDVEYTVSDSNGGSNTGTLFITVTPVNDPPVALDDSNTTNEDTPVSGTVIANDSDVDGNLNPAGYSIIAGPSNGILVLNPNGTYTYTPDPDYFGTDSFIYEVCDLGLPVYCDQATVTITISSDNDTPLAVNDIAVTPEDTPVSGNVLTNDSDPDGDLLTVVDFTIDGTTYPAGSTAVLTGTGSLVIHPDGTFTFTPDPGFNGAVPVAGYTITDGTDNATATLSIFVNPVNDSPVALDDTYSTPEDTPFNDNILLNDSDPDSDPLTVVSFIINSITYPAGASVNVPATGNVTIYSNGLIVFVPADGFNGNVPTIPYTITDGNGGTATAVIDITVTPLNDAPVAVDDYYSTTEDTSVSGDVLINDTDPEGDLLTLTDFTIDGTTYPAGATATITGVGTILLNTDGSFTFTPAADYNGNVPAVDYTVTDSNGGSDTGTLFILVAPVNDPPVALDDSNTTGEDTPLTGTVIANDSDVDGNLNPSSYSIVTGPANGTLVLNPNGTYTYTPDISYHGTDSFVYEVCDLGLPVYCDQATVTITIDPVNDNPVAVNDWNTTPEDTPVSGDVLTNDSDPEGDPLMVTQFIVDGDASIYLPGDVATIIGVGTIQINSDGTYSFNPALNYTGTVPSVSYTLSDGNGGTDTAGLYITVTPVNDPPVAVVDYFNTLEDTPVSGTVITNDFDVDGNLNPVSYLLTGDVSNGSLTFNALGIFTYTPDPGFSGTDSFIYSMCDLGLPVYCDTAIVFINISGVNDPPVVFNESVAVCSGNTVTGNVLANGDYDPEGTALTVDLVPVSGPAGGVFNILADGSFTYTANAGFTGIEEIVISLCDAGIPLPSACSNDTIFIDVLEPALANAGPDQDLCNLTFTLLDGNTVAAASVEWTQVSGPPCIIVAANTPDAIAFGLIPGTYVFRYSVDNGSCSDSDEVSVVNWSTPTSANAGPDQSLCGLSSTSLSANTPVTGSGNWSQQSGPSAAIIADPTDPSVTISNLVAGSYVFRWTISNGPVCAPSADDVIISVANAASASAGPDATICQGSDYNLSSASAGNYTSVLWTTSGSGTFSNPAAVNPVYSPSNSDIIDGTVTLTILAVSASPCPNATDQMVLDISRQAIVTAGLDATICEGSSHTLSTAFAVSATGYLWATSGDGTFNDATILNPVYTPGVADISSGTVILTLTAFSAAPCGPSGDLMVLSISQQASANAGVDATICEGSTYTLADATAPDASTVLWTTSGTGTFNNAALVNPVYTPSPNDILDGFVTLTMTVTSASPCPGDIDPMVLTISRQAIVNAGVNATICEGSSYSPVTALAVNATSILWTSDGDGSFDDATILNPLYTPGTTDIAAGTVTLTLTAQSATPCGPASDVMVLTISQQASAYAGLDATICEGSVYTLADATAPDASTVLWTTSGTGTFNSAALVNPVYTPSPNDILDGFVTLTMSVTSASPCTGDVDQMLLNINRLAVVSAGFDAAICEGQTFTPVTASATNAVSLLWTTSGTGTFDDATVLYPVYTPGAADITAGTVMLTLTAPSAFPCPVATDNMILTVSPQAIAFAGADAVICEGSTYSLADAVATNAANILWTTTGTGTFNNQTIANPVYTPSPNDILDGFVTLTMIVNSDPPCGGDFDEMVLTISRQANVYAGPDVSICNAIPYIVSGATGQYATSLLWTTSGTGTFDDATTLNPEYTPGPEDLTAGSVTLTLTAQSSAPCGPDSDAMILTISQQATAYAGADNIICEGSVYAIGDATTTNATSVLWTTSGTGLFNNPTLVNPTYIPSPNDIQDGFVTLTMFVNSAAPCIGVSDAMALTISRQAFVNAGANATICEGSDYAVISATQQFTTGILWTTSGTGTFDDPTLINPVYTPGASDLAAGTVTLTITGQSAAPCTPVSDDMILTISSQATAYAGADIIICEGPAYTLADASATDAVTIIWTSSGTGFFNNPALINPTYIPSLSDIQDGSVTLTMFVTSASPCPGASDVMVLGISRQAAVDAGQNAAICEGSSFSLSGATSQNATSLLWTSSGTGTFDDATLLNPEYTPGADDIQAGTVTLTITGQSAAPCGPDSDQMVLTISHQASANAGADNIICEGSTYTIADATAVNAVTVYWTTTGTGVFNNPALVNPTYIPSPNDILDGFVTLTMYVSSASPCIGASDAMVLGISRQAFVDAGQNAAICEGSAYTLSGATSQNATGLIWATSGTGTFDDPTILHPVYTPGAADISAGSVVLTLTGQSAAPCGPDSDAMTLVISQQATAYAGEDATICEGSTYTLSGAVAGDALSILWTTSGTGIFNNPAIANPTYIPSQNDILDGMVVLTMYANAASPCPGASDAMVLSISRQAVVYAGPDVSICEGSVLPLDQATQSNATALLWTTSGTGTFSDPTILNPVYTPGGDDISAGLVTLTLSATSAAPCSQTSDAMVLSISRQATADAGPDDAICGSTSYTLSDANAGNYVSVYWTTSGTGTFNNPNLVNPVYTPSQNDTQDGQVTLTLTAYPDAPCGNVSDAMVLTISAPVEIFAGADATICDGGSYQLSDATQNNTVSVLWITSGTGTFDDPALLNPVYTPGAEDILNGSVTLTITGEAAPPCDNVSDDVIITISPQAIAFAGEDYTICGGVSYTISDATATNAETIMWTTTGTGVFNNPGIANPTYTPSQNDILDGYVNLTMMVTSAEPCSGASDEMTLNISRQALVNAGADATICENETFVPVGASQQNATSILWTTTGTGTFSDATILLPIYTPGAQDIASGSVTLILSAVSAIPCVEVSDSLVLSFSLQAMVSAGQDATVCSGADYTLSGAVASGYTSLLWTTSGTGIFTDATVLNAVYLPSNSDLFNEQVILTLTAESATGCVSATDQMVLTIDGLPFADAGPDLSVCQGESLQIISATAADYVTIYWTYTGMGSMIGTNTLTPTYVPAVNETGNIILTLNVTGSEACGGLLYSDEMILTIKQKVVADAGEDQTIPYNSTTNLIGGATNGSGSYVYNWQPSGLLVNNNTPNPETLQLTNHTDFILVVTDVVTGCQDVDSMRVTIDGINYPPVANDDFDTTKYNTPVRIDILGNDSDPENGALTITFCGYPLNGLVILNSNNTITYQPFEGFSGDDSLCYQICDKGIPVMCDQAMVYIHVLPKPNIEDVVIYNGISPNGDGINDTWTIKGIEGFPDNEVKIFNRWGDRIRNLSRYDNINVFWDGTNAEGEPVPDGTYYYILEVWGVKTFTGWIYVRSEN